MVPKVSNLAVSGTLRVILRPLLPEVRRALGWRRAAAAAGDAPMDAAGPRLPPAAPGHSIGSASGACRASHGCRPLPAVLHQPPQIPGFGAAVVSLRAPPIIRFALDFGKGFGGSYSAGAIKVCACLCVGLACLFSLLIPLCLAAVSPTAAAAALTTLVLHPYLSARVLPSLSTQAWLDPFLRETVTGMLLWPRRLVIPILPEAVTGPLGDLYLRCARPRCARCAPRRAARAVLRAVLCTLRRRRPPSPPLPPLAQRVLPAPPPTPRALSSLAQAPGRAAGGVHRGSGPAAHGHGRHE